MRRLGLLALLLSTAAFAGPRPLAMFLRNRFPGNGLASSGKVFQFLPADVAFTECSDAATYAGAKGEALTFTRSSTAYCTKGDGSMVLLSANKPRVQCDATGKACALFYETQHINYSLSSEDYSAWSGSATVTADSATYLAPSGSSTADVVLSPNSSTSKWRTVTGLPSGTQWVHSAYVRESGNGTQATVTTNCSPNNATVCTCYANGRTCTTSQPDARVCYAHVTTDSTWVRVQSRVTCAAAATQLDVDVAGSQLGAPVSSGSAAFWGDQVEPGEAASSYYPAAGAVGTMTDDTPSFAATFATGGTPCLGYTMRAFRPTRGFVVQAGSSTDRMGARWFGNTNMAGEFRIANVAQTNSTASGGSSVALASQRLVVKGNGANSFMCLSGVCGTGIAISTPASSITGVSFAPHSNPVSVLLSNLVIDSTSIGCN